MNSGIFFLPPNKKMSFGENQKIAMLGFRSTKNHPNQPASRAAKKMLKLGTPIEPALGDSKLKRFVALVWSMLALTPVKESTALLQTAITFVPSLRLGCFFCLNRRIIRRTFRKPSAGALFAHLKRRCCVDCRRFLACFCS